MDDNAMMKPIFLYNECVLIKKFKYSWKQMFSFHYFIMHNYIEYSWDLFSVTLLYLIRMLLLFSFVFETEPNVPLAILQYVM